MGNAPGAAAEVSGRGRGGWAGARRNDTVRLRQLVARAFRAQRQLKEVVSRQAARAHSDRLCAHIRPDRASRDKTRAIVQDRRRVARCARCECRPAAGSRQLDALREAAAYPESITWTEGAQAAHKCQVEPANSADANNGAQF